MMSSASQRAKDSADELLMIARSARGLTNKQKASLHRAARLFDSVIPKEDRPTPKGRYGGRQLPAINPVFNVTAAEQEALL